MENIKSLSQLKVGSKFKVVSVGDECVAKKKFADIGIIKGAEIVLEAQAPFGGLIRVKVLDSSMSMHRDDGKHIMGEVQL